MSTVRRKIGERGEELAATWYAEEGYRILDRNWRCAEGEIDLVCSLGSTVVICEVKARRTDAYGSPLDAVTMPKRRRLRRLAAHWLRAHQMSFDTVRFDVAAVRGDRVEVLTGAW